MRVAVLVTCHNRREISVKNLAQLELCLASLKSIDHTMFIVDDGSTDGTGDALRNELPGAHVIEGTGNLFWNGGMCAAYQKAREHGSFDAYLLFNDDVFVLQDRIESFFAEYMELNVDHEAILAGSTESEFGNQITYSAKKLPYPNRPMAFTAILPTGKVERCDSFNGNFVLLPGDFYESIGGNDPKFVHAYGDVDLGLVAGKMGVGSFLASASIGYCEINVHFKDNIGISKKLSSFVFGNWLPVRDSLGERLHYISKHCQPPFLYLQLFKYCVQYGLNSLKKKVKS